MLEVLFSDSACGSLKMAQHYGKGEFSSGCTGVIISHSDGSKPTKAEIKSAKQEFEEKSRLAWENAVPLGGNSTDIFSLYLGLSIGDISEENFGAKRQRALEQRFSSCPKEERNQEAEKILTSADESLENIHRRAQAGESIRIWYSNQPDDMCGLYWLMSQITQWGIEDIEIVTVKLPEWEADGNDIIQRSGWDEVPPEAWRHYLSLQKPVPWGLIQNCASSWCELKNENAPLRAVLNGKLISSSENLYDSFILREIAAEGDEFNEVDVICRVLIKYQLGIGDAWVALRIEEMIKAGKLKAISSAGADMPSYRRKLKKIIR